MPQLQGQQLKDTQITGGQISTTSIGADGKSTALEMYNTSQFEKPDAPHSVVTASDGSQWYQMASGAGAGAFYDAPAFMGSPSEAAQVAAAFPDASEGTTLRTVGDGVIEASSDSGNTMWYNSAYYDEPDAPHTIMQSANGVDWYAMQQHAEAPAFEQGEAALPITRRSSSSLCRDMNSRYPLWMDPGVRMAILRSAMKMDPEPCSTIHPSMRLPVGIIRCLKMPAEASGMRFAAKPPWNASRCTRMASRFMTVTVYGQSLWKLFGIRIRHHALESQTPQSWGN